MQTVAHLDSPALQSSFVLGRFPVVRAKLRALASVPQSSSWSVGDRSGCERLDEGREQAAESKRRKQAAGVSRVPPGNDRGRRMPTREPTLFGPKPSKCENIPNSSL